VTITVDNYLCHRYGFCEAEAPGIFRITEDGRLDYDPHPPIDEQSNARMAARCCPMRAIHLESR
jgi:sulfoxide reductase heme-binding subunit YedZ